VTSKASLSISPGAPSVLADGTTDPVSILFVDGVTKDAAIIESNREILSVLFAE